MAAVGSVTIGSKKIDLHAFTGEVISSSTSSETETTLNEDGHQVKSRKWTYNKFVLRGADGSTQGTEVDTRQATVTEGEQVTLFWGTVGTKASGYLAVYKHASNKLGVVWETRNQLATPALLRSQIVLTILALVFLVAFVATSGMGSVIVLGMMVGLWYWLHRRRQTLIQAVEAAIPRVKAELAAAR
jgi:hypothetical protein